MTPARISLVVCMTIFTMPFSRCMGYTDAGDDTGLWRRVATLNQGPSARFSVAGDCLDEWRGILVLIGGCNKDLEALDDMYYLHTDIPRGSGLYGQGKEKFSLKRELKKKCQENSIPVRRVENTIDTPKIVMIPDSLHPLNVQEHNHPARKRVHISTIVNATGRRSSTFRTNLWKAVKYSLEKRQSETSTPELSLQDLMTSINEGISLLKASKVKSGKSTCSASGCCEVDQLEPREMIEHLRNGLGIHGQIVHVEDIPAKLAVQAKFPEGLSEISIASLKRIGISSLYSHQAEAVHASLSGKNVVIATSTSSGKSLCYNIPVLESLSQNLLSCALYIFPTKALAQDQLRALLDMTEGMDIGLNISVYDGDTSQGHRSWIRDNARLLITKPDMLHVSILPYHRQFERLLSNLRFIIIDEAHTYKGAFECHTAFVLRRLRRICYHAYGSDPSFIFSTATSANPRDHAMELANLRSLELIQKDGSPRGPKYFLLWNPPFQRSNGSKAKNKHERRSASEYSSTRRSSPILETSHLFAEMVQHGLRCIAFCKTRKLTELVLCYTRGILQETSPNLVDSICVYRGGYTPQDRRRIETDFFGGKLWGVAATNALELGIDVGHIDATLHLGFPGSVASLWQQAGRSGRRSRPSLSIYVAFEGPLDPYFMKYPHKLFQRSIEHCQVDSQNYKVLEQHVTCAALELPVCSHYDEMYFGSSLNNAIANLENKGYLGETVTCC